MKTAVQRMARSLGFEIHRYRPREPDPIIHSLTPDIPHELIRTNSTYAPWLADHEFTSFYETIRQHTLVDLYRCYELWTLADRMAQLGDAIEIGVWRGGTGALIAHRMPNRFVYLCDTFNGVIGAGPRDTRYKGGEHADASVKTLMEFTERMGLRNTRIIVGAFPHETQAKITIDRLALVHIDVDVHDSAKWCFDWAWPRMIPGGVIIFDDYGAHGCEGVTRMVNSIDATVIYNLNGHAIIFKT